MEKEQSIIILQRKRSATTALLGVSALSPDFTKWKRDTEIAIERMFGAQTRNLDDFNRVRYSLGMFMTDTPDRGSRKRIAAVWNMPPRCWIR